MNRKQVLSSWKYKLNLFKMYFEKGYSLVSFPKWVAAVFGIGSVINKNYLIVVIGAFAFMLGCILLGWIWLRYDFYLAEIEVSNQYNLFVKELRGNRKIFK